jgi:cytochrome P450
MTINDKFYPGNMEVAVISWVLHRDRAIFGDDAESYRPERWLEPGAKEMNRYMFQVSLS